MFLRVVDWSSTRANVRLSAYGLKISSAVFLKKKAAHRGMSGLFFISKKK
jgi:hypothetical protein